MLVAVQLIDIVGFGGVLAVCAGMLYLASRIEPHWAAKDGSRFLTVAQELDQWGTPFGRKHEVRVNIDPDTDALVIRRRSLMRPSSDLYTLSAKVTSPPRGRAVFLLKKVNPTGEAVQLALRLPAKSKIVKRFDAILAANERPLPRSPTPPTPTPPVRPEPMSSRASPPPPDQPPAVDAPPPPPSPAGDAGAPEPAVGETESQSPGPNASDPPSSEPPDAGRDD